MSDNLKVGGAACQLHRLPSPSPSSQPCLLIVSLDFPDAAFRCAACKVDSCKEEFWSETCGGIEDNACGECEDGCAGRHHLVAPRCPLHSCTAQCAGTTVPPYLVSTGQEGLISQRSGANLQERGERVGGWLTLGGESRCGAFLGSRNFQRSQDQRFSFFEMESLVSKSNESVTQFVFIL